MTETDVVPVEFFKEDPDADAMELKRMRELLQQMFPVLRRQVLRLTRDESLVSHYMDRLYSRLRGRLGQVELDERAVMSRLVSLVNEDQQRTQTRFDDKSASRLEVVEDRQSGHFLKDLIVRSELALFKQCASPWIVMVINLRLGPAADKMDKEIAAMLGMHQYAFSKRWNRGIEEAKQEYARRTGKPVP